MYKVISFDRATRTRSKDFFSLAPTPVNEICTEAGKDAILGITESTALVNQLIREQGLPPEGIEFFILRNEHDFGSYYEAAIFYDEPKEMDEDQESQALLYAQKTESNIPENWDSLAKQELREKGHPLYTNLQRL